tara:strand:+ start:2301 stop:3083 length:783 start_codon:yes stop_codon:yes gene_type:complete
MERFGFSDIDISRFEAVERKEFSLSKRGDSWIATDPSGSYIEIEDNNLGLAMSVALKVQEKVDKSFKEGKITPLQERFASINCRKIAWLARHPEDLSKMASLVDIRNYDPDNAQERERISGIPELKREVIAMLDLGISPLVGTSDDFHLHETLQSAPSIVHMFNVEIEKADELIERILANEEVGEYINKDMHRDHTFIFLGKDTSGRHVCFHKGGSGVDDPVEIVDIDSVLAPLRIGNDNRIFLSMVGPLDSIRRAEKDY